MSLSSAKALGGVGSILVFIPFVSIIGYILILVAVKEISDDLQDKAIFNNIIVAAATGIIGALAGGLVIVGFARATTIAGFVGILAGLFIVWIFLIISAVFLRRSYTRMADRLGVGMFGTASILYLVGAALTIILVGFIILLVAQILQAVAYFSIPDQVPNQAASPATAAPSMPPPAIAPGEPSKFCTSCGAQISAAATFCNRCGAKQP